MMVAISGNGWRLAPALVDLVDEIDERWPKRPTGSDGSIGDTSHAARKSEHNPDRDSDGMPDGFVSAVDITRISGAAMDEIRHRLMRDPRTWYVIHQGTIWSRTHDWAARPYTGVNAHAKHMHVSLLQTRSAAAGGPWGIAGAAEDKPEYEVLASGVKPGRRHPQVKTLQRLLNKAGYGPIKGSVTDFYGEQTQAAVARFHKANPRLASDSDYDPQIGPKGWAELAREARR